jgi:hypothetical protein
MALGNEAFTQLFSTTLQKYERVLADNILLTHPTLELFKENAKSYTGRGLVIPVRAASLSGTAYSDDSGSHGTSVSNDLIGAAVYDWAKEIITPFRVKHREILQNSGPEQVVSLVEEYVKGATGSHQDFIVAELYATSTGTGELLSLLDLVAATDKVSTTAARTVGGIRGGVSVQTITDVARDASDNTTLAFSAASHDFIVGDEVVVAGTTADSGSMNGTWTITAVAAQTITFVSAGATVASIANPGTATVAAVKDFWRSTVKTIAKTGGSAKDILAAFREVVNAIYSASRKRPTHIIAGFNVYEEFEAYLQDKGRYDFASTGKAETRFREIMFDGIPVRLDPDCPTNSAFFLHAPALRFGYLAGEFMKAYPGDRVQGNLDEVVPLASTLSVGTSERRAHGRLIRS